jgi:thymidylate synthase
MMTVWGVRARLAALLQDRVFVGDKTGVRCVELVGNSFVCDEPTIFGELNEDWSRREVEWYDSMSLSVNDIPPPVPQIWKQVASDKGLINSNYGYLAYHHRNYAQYSRVLGELYHNPESRRAVMVYTRPSIWEEYDRGGMSDFICTNAVQYLIRDKKLHVVVQMRSSDAVFGYKGDLYWQQEVQRRLARDLKVEPGPIIWNAGSLHVYERHFYLIDYWINTDQVTIKKEEYKKLYPNSEWGNSG